MLGASPFSPFPSVRENEADPSTVEKCDVSMLSGKIAFLYFPACFDGSGFVLSFLSEREGVHSADSPALRVSSLSLSFVCVCFVFLLCQFSCAYVWWWCVGHLKFIYHIKEILSLVLFCRGSGCWKTGKNRLQLCEIK